MLAKEGRSPEDLRAEVTSAGGTTAAATRAFEEGGFRQLVERAMRAARDRSRELGR
jgi:pyrroline-5-carboxylate reductase